VRTDAFVQPAGSVTRLSELRRLGSANAVMAEAGLQSLFRTFLANVGAVRNLLSG
jgi:hypothetical protein